MNTAPDLTRFVSSLQLSRLGDDTEAGLCITSLPWPRATTPELALGGRATYCKPLGQWPDEASPSPRRLLMIADGGNEAPEQLSLTQLPLSSEEPPQAAMNLLQRSPEPAFMWENHLLQISYGGKTVELVLGLRTGDSIHWWEACNMVVLEETPTCRVVEMGGNIPVERMTLDMLKEDPGFTNRFLHRHNWLNGHMYVRLHANGVCEVFAHHINSKFYDDGLPLKDAIPVIGIRTGATEAEVQALSGPWDGSRSTLEVGGVRFDVQEAARLATPEQPGSIGETDGLLVWQPYEGVEVYGGKAALAITGDAYICHASDHVIPRGVARTTRFSLSLSDRSPRIARYIAPAWWYGVCEEFMPAPLLLVSNVYDTRAEEALQWARDVIIQRGFEAGAVPMYSPKTNEDGTVWNSEVGLKGDLAYALLLSAWRTGSGDDYNNALRAAYHFTDVGVDHAMKMVRMQGFQPGTFTPTLNRMQGSIAAYLETGDPYLLDTAQAVIDVTWWTHKESWPRMAVGRDACFISGTLLMYRYFADEHYRRIAYAACRTVADSQRPDGSFGDQGGGAGLHAFASYITKPWMGTLATDGVLDYLELFPDEPELLEVIWKFANWLMEARYDHEGVTGWSYQHGYDGGKRYYEMYSGTWVDLPTSGLWHQDSLARLLGFCTLQSGDTSYLDAWAESYAASELSGDYSVTAALLRLPWIQTKLWQAKLLEPISASSDTTVQVQPLHFGPRTPPKATILAPQGPMEVSWIEAGQVEAPAEVAVIAK